jgi:hypothetical protein
MQEAVGLTSPATKNDNNYRRRRSKTISLMTHQSDDDSAGVPSWLEAEGCLAKLIVNWR